jgi:hypothetical protein
VATGYTGTATFGVTIPDAGKVLPVSHTFVGGDAGVHVMSVTLTAPATSQAVTATDTVHSLSGSTADLHPITVSRGAASRISLVLSPASIVADPDCGTAACRSTATVTVADAYGNPVAGETIAVVMEHDGSVGSVTDNGDGTSPRPTRAPRASRHRPP